MAIDNKDMFYEKYQKMNTFPIKDMNVHLEFANKLEKSGFLSEAAKEYNLAIRDGYEKLDVYYTLADYYYDMGKLKKAFKLYETILNQNQDETAAAVKMGDILAQSDQLDKTRKLYTILFNKTHNPLYKNYLNETTKILNAHEEKILKTKTEENFYSDTAILKILDLFSGRSGIYARQWAKADGQSGYAPVYEHLNHQALKNHLLGNHTVGVYQLTHEGLVRWAALDVDLEKNIWKKIEKGELDISPYLKQALKTAIHLKSALSRFSIPSYIEFSGFKGYHVWIFFKNPMEPNPVKAFLTKILQDTPPSSPNVHVEIFPKQTRLSGKGLGNLIKLPLGIHKKSRRFSFFLDENNQKVDHHETFVLQIRSLGENHFYNTLSKLNTSPSPKDSDVFFDASETECHELPVPQPKIKAQAPETPDWFHFDPFATPEFNHLVLSCPIINHIARKALKEKELNSDERTVLTYSLGHLPQGAELVNYFLAQLKDIKNSDLLKSKLNGNPISCPNIRKRLSSLANQLNCNCDFHGIGAYPHPLLHLNSIVINNSNMKDELKTLFSQFIQLQAKLTDLRREGELIKTRMITLMSKEKLNKIDINGKKLRLVTEEGKPPLLEINS